MSLNFPPFNRTKTLNTFMGSDIQTDKKKWGEFVGKMCGVGDINLKPKPFSTKG